MVGLVETMRVSFIAGWPQRPLSDSAADSHIATSLKSVTVDDEVIRAAGKADGRQLAAYSLRPGSGRDWVLEGAVTANGRREPEGASRASRVDPADVV